MVALLYGILAPACTNHPDEIPLSSAASALQTNNGIDWNGIDWNGIDWNGIDWNGIDWNGIDWNGIDWNGIDWNGIDWNGIDWNGNDWSSVDWDGTNWRDIPWNDIAWTGDSWNGIDWQSLDWGGITWDSVNWKRVKWRKRDWRQNFPGIADEWSGLGWFVRGRKRHRPKKKVGAFFVTNPSIRSWVLNAPDADTRDQRLHALGKLVEGSACEGWPVVFGEVDGQQVGWQGKWCLAPSMWGLGPQDVDQSRYLSAYIITLLNSSAQLVSLRAPLPTMATDAAERADYPVPQGCYAGDLFRSVPIKRAFATHEVTATDSDFAARDCRVGVAELNALPALSTAGAAGNLSDPCTIEWTQSAQQVPLPGYETGDANAVISHCEPANGHGEVSACRLFSYDLYSHPADGDIHVATTIDDYPTVCAYLPVNAP